MRNFLHGDINLMRRGLSLAAQGVRLPLSNNVVVVEGHRLIYEEESERGREEIRYQIGEDIWGTVRKQDKGGSGGGGLLLPRGGEE